MPPFPPLRRSFSPATSRLFSVDLSSILYGHVRYWFEYVFHPPYSLQSLTMFAQFPYVRQLPFWLHPSTQNSFEHIYSSSPRLDTLLMSQDTQVYYTIFSLPLVNQSFVSNHSNSKMLSSGVAHSM